MANRLPKRQQAGKNPRNEFVENAVASWIPQNTAKILSGGSVNMGPITDGTNDTKAFGGVAGTTGIRIEPSMRINGDRVEVIQTAYQNGDYEENRPSSKMVDDAFSNKLKRSDGLPMSDAEKIMILRCYLGIDLVQPNAGGNYFFVTKLSNVDGVPGPSEFAIAIKDQYKARLFQDEIMKEEKQIESERKKGKIGQTVAVRTSPVDTSKNYQNGVSLPTIRPIETREVTVNGVTTTTPIIPEYIVYNILKNKLKLDPDDPKNTDEIDRIRAQYTLNITSGISAGDQSPRVDKDNNWIGAPPYNTHIQGIIQYEKSNPLIKGTKAIKKTGSNTVLGLSAAYVAVGVGEATGLIGNGLVSSLNNILKTKYPTVSGAKGFIMDAIHKVEGPLVLAKAGYTLLTKASFENVSDAAVEAAIPVAIYYASSGITSALATAIGAGFAAGIPGLILTALYIYASNQAEKESKKEKERQESKQKLQQRADKNGEWFSVLDQTNGAWTVPLGREVNSVTYIVEAGKRVVDESARLTRVELSNVKHDGLYRLPIGYEQDQKTGLWLPKYSEKDNLIYNSKEGFPLTPGGMVIKKDTESVPPKVNPVTTPTWQIPSTRGKYYQDNIKTRNPSDVKWRLFNWNPQQESNHNSILIDIHNQGKQQNFVEMIRNVNNNNTDGGANLNNNGPNISTGPSSAPVSSIDDSNLELNRIREYLNEELITYVGSDVSDDFYSGRVISENNGINPDPSNRGCNIQIGPSSVINVDGKPVKIIIDSMGRERFKFIRTVKNKESIPPIVG